MALAELKAGALWVAWPAHGGRIAARCASLTTTSKPDLASSFLSSLAAVVVVVDVLGSDTRAANFSPAAQADRALLAVCRHTALAHIAVRPGEGQARIGKDNGRAANCQLLAGGWCILDF